MRGDEVRGHLDLLLLSVLSEDPLHGYGVIERLRARSDDTFDLPEGTVYPALHRLERERLVSSSWESGDNARKRRLYTVTPAGRKHLKKRRAEWAGFARAVAAVVGEAP
jgi:transcriptional regulator